MANRARDARERMQARWPGAMVIGRSRTAIYHRHPTLQQVSIDAVIGAMHKLDDITEIDTAWRPSISPWDFEVTSADYLTKVKAQFNAADVAEWSRGGEYIRFIARQLEYNNDRNDVQLIAAAQAVTGTVDDERISWPGAYGAGLDFKWINRDTRLAKLLTIQSLASLPTPSAQILGGANPVLRLQFQFSVSINVDIYINGARWNQTGQRDTTGLVEFRHASTGESLWYFDVGKAWDTGAPEHDVVQIAPVIRFRKTGPSLFVEVRVPWSFLETANYPVKVDPTIDVSVGASADDAAEASNGTTSITGTTINNQLDNIAEWAGFRFTGITITSYTSMVASYLTLYFASSTEDEPDVTIWGEDNSSPVQYDGSNNDISNRTRTTASGTMASTNLGAPGSFNTDSLNTVIDELATSYTYSSGVMAFDFRSTSGTTTRDCTPSTWDNTTDDAPALHIEYNQGGISLVIADASHIHTADNIALTQHNALAAQDASHTHSTDPVALVQHNILAVADTAHTHGADNVALTAHEPATQLEIQDATHGHTADGPDLTQHNLLAVQDASHAHTAESPGMVQHNVLAIQDGAHAHTAEVIELTQHNALVIADAAHGHIADNIDLTAHAPGGITLSIQDASHAHTAESLALVQHNELSIADGAHGHAAENISLTQHHILAIQEAAHTHSAEAVELLQHSILSIADGAHGHASDNLELIAHDPGAVLLVIQDAAHLHKAENVFWAASTPSERIYMASGDRGRQIDLAERVYVVAQERRS